MKTLIKKSVLDLTKDELILLSAKWSVKVSKNMDKATVLRKVRRVLTPNSRLLVADIFLDIHVVTF